MRKFPELKNFLVLGLVNFCFTNLALQITLLLLPIWISTLLSQIINFLLGFYFYGKLVFKKKFLNQRIAFKYLLMASFAWLFNTFFIYLISKYTNFSPGLAAIIVIPLIVSYSFLAQKYFVFKK